MQRSAQDGNGDRRRERVHLRSPRLDLRPCRRSDVDALHALWTDPDVRRFLWDDVVIPRETAARKVEEALASFDDHGFGQWLIHRRGGRELMGFCGLQFVQGTNEVELLYGLYPRFWGEGYATEASRSVLRYGFESVGLERIVARADTPNRASVRVMQALGMVWEGEKTVNGLPTLQYALSREAFRTRAE